MPRLSRTRVRNQARRRKLVALRRRNRREQRAARKKGLSLCRSERKGLANDEIETAQALPQTTRHQGRWPSTRTWPGARNASLCGLPISPGGVPAPQRRRSLSTRTRRPWTARRLPPRPTAALMRRVGHLVELGLARQLPYLPSVPGAPA